MVRPMKADAALRLHAQKKALAFKKENADYQLGDVEAEQPHPLTGRMSQTFERSVKDGLQLLAECDGLLAPKLAQTVEEPAYHDFEASITQTLRSGGRVMLSGCGSSGRLCMRIENSWRKAVANLQAGFPRARDALTPAMEQVMAVMTGGDYAVIRAVEFFEDYSQLGREQVRRLRLTKDDLLIGVTATGETTAVLGSAAQALDDGAAVWMLVCSRIEPLLARMPRCRDVYGRARSNTLYLPCGPMALTGSTRMQSSTYEQAVLGIAMERALHALCGQAAIPCAGQSAPWYARAFARLVSQLKAERALSAVAAQIEREESCYRGRGLMTYFADAYLLDVLTDTTERSPTFMIPPFRATGEAGNPSWAFVKNPACTVREAWRRCFGHEPRCIDWPAEDYVRLGIERERAIALPAIDKQALYGFPIGRDAAPQREASPGSLAVWVGKGAPPALFWQCAAAYHTQAVFTLDDAGLDVAATLLDLYEHLAMKMMLNAMSTGVMTRMGRVDGNRMTYLAISNKKLIDRSARIIAAHCGVPYLTALEELFLTQSLLEQAPVKDVSPAQETIRRLLGSAPHPA